MKRDQFMTSVVRHLLHGSGQLIIEHLSLNTGDLLTWLEDGPVRVVPSSDGPVSVVRDDGDPVDFNHHGRNFDFHTDGLYHPVVPDFVGLYCVNPGNGATRTVFADTRQALSRMAVGGCMEKLLESHVVWIKKDASEHVKPLVVPHPRTGERVVHMTARGYIRPKSEVMQIASMPPLRDFVAAQARLFEALDDSICHEHEWIAGQLVLFDNYTYVHARRASRRDPDRLLYRFWLSVND
jgi:alpha-ketoglutarate-dependent taurine dioxygenase